MIGGELSILTAVGEESVGEKPRGRRRVVEGIDGWAVTTEAGVLLGVVTETGSAPDVRYTAQTREPKPCAVMFGRGWNDRDRTPRGYTSLDAAADALYDAVIEHRYAWSTVHKALVPYDMA